MKNRLVNYHNRKFRSFNFTSAILILKLLRDFMASTLAIVDDRMRVAAVLFLKTTNAENFDRSFSPTSAYTIGLE